MKGPNKKTKFIVIDEQLFKFLLPEAQKCGMSVNELIGIMLEQQQTKEEVGFPPIVAVGTLTKRCSSTKAIRVSNEFYANLRQVQQKLKTHGLAIDLTSVLQGRIFRFLWKGASSIPVRLVDEYDRTRWYYPTFLVMWNKNTRSLELFRTDTKVWSPTSWDDVVGWNTR